MEGAMTIPVRTIDIVTLKDWLEPLSNVSAIIATIVAIVAAIFVSRQIAHMKRSREVDTFLRILEAGNTEAIRLASLWVKTNITPQTTYEETSKVEYRENIGIIINYFEMVGILAQRCYISKNLIYDQMGSWIVGTWAKLRTIIAAHRTAKKSPQYAENFELLVTGYDIWAKKNPPKLEKRLRPNGETLENFY